MRLHRGALIAYTFEKPRGLIFDFNPKSLKRTRRMSGSTSSMPGRRRGTDFTSPQDAHRATEGLSVDSETISLEILLDATDQLERGDELVQLTGVEPEIDTLRALVDGDDGGADLAGLLSAIVGGGGRARDHDTAVPVVLFVWGQRVLPVSITQLDITETAHLSNLVPYRAEVSLALRVIESKNPFWTVEQARRTANVVLNTGRTGAHLLGALL